MIEKLVSDSIAVASGVAKGRGPHGGWSRWLARCACLVAGGLVLVASPNHARAFGETVCAGTRANANLNCTAGDVALNSIVVEGATLGSCVGGSTLPLNLRVSIAFGSSSRYNIGVFLSNTGLSPQLKESSGGSGQCSVATLPNTSPFQNLDGNVCGDGGNSLNGSFLMPNVQVPCITDGSGSISLYIPYVISWDQQSGVCTGPNDVVPGNSAKCSGGTVTFPPGSGIVVLPRVTIDDGRTSVSPGQTVTYTIVIDNTTGSALSNVGFRDPLPANFTFTGVTCAATGGVVCPSIDTGTLVSGVSVGSMPNGAKLTFTVTGTVGSATCASLIHTVYATMSGQTVSATDSDAIGSACPPAAAKAFDPPTILPGATTLLGITLSNPSGSALTGVGFTDNYPAGLLNANTPVVTNSCGGTVSAPANGSTLSLSGGTVPANGTCRVTSIVTAAATGTYTNSTGPIAASPTGIASASGSLAVGGVDHIRIVHDGSGGVCSGDVVTLKACADASCSALYTGGGTVVTLSPAGGWSPGSSITIDSTGTATVTYQTDLKGTVRYAVSSHGFDCDNTSDGSSTNATTQCDAVFSDNEFVITSVDPLGDVVVAGRPHRMRIEAHRKQGSRCGIAGNYKNSKTLHAWYSDVVSLTPSPLPTLSASSDCAAAFPATGLPAADPGSNNVTLDFVNGVADPVYLCTGDVGRFSLELQDTSPSILTGSTAVLTVRPFALLPAVAGSSGAATATLANGGSAVAAAGDPLAASVRAVRWAAGDDLDNDGVPDAAADLADNAVAASFAATVPLAAADVAPSTGPGDPALREVDTGGGGWAGGVWTGSVHFDNVGALRLQAGPLASYLGTVLTVPAATSGAVGRIKPHHFGVAGGALTAGCGAASTLTYVGQDFTAGFTVQALNALGLVATNYGRAGYAPLATGGALTLRATQGATVFDSTSASGLVPNAAVGPPAVLQIPATAAAGGWADGQVEYPGSSGQPAAFALARPATPIGPFAGMTVGVRVADTSADAVPFWGASSVLVAPVCAGTASCEAALGATDMHYGRAVVGNAFGSEKLTLALPATTQYWTGNYWVTETLDRGCSSVSSVAAPTITRTSGTGTVTYTAGSVYSTSAATPGRFGLVLTTTGPAAVDLGYTVSSWLQHPWSGGATMQNPSAKASFGLYPGSSRFIYRRELR